MSDLFDIAVGWDGMSNPFNWGGGTFLLLYSDFSNIKWATLIGLYNYIC